MSPLEPNSSLPLTPPASHPSTPGPSPTNPPASLLAQLSPEARQGILNLAAYTPPPIREEFGKVKRAGVLVALFERSESPGLRVLLTTRSKNLRSHPGQTALPGGKMDPTDPSFEFTARREAHEECLLPPSHPLVHTLPSLQPFLSKFGLVVHASLVFVASPHLIDALVASPDEVDHIWEVPLESCLNIGYWPKALGATGEGLEDGKLSTKGGDDWLYTEDVYSTTDTEWKADTLYRMHRFRTTSTPIKGLTSDILIETASLAFAHPPIGFSRFPPGQDRTTWDLAIDFCVNESLEEGWEERRKIRESAVQH
ncbi:NUDIX hydrolase domain-like protein [Mrakia frigida]|uniref:NUDIX hydrolase n=1 Tax=Mrakia frigida TaxID=29902 RepID=UPI003FCC08B2